MRIPSERPPVLDLPYPADDDRSARAAALRSRAAVHAGDREKWLSLFTEDAVVEDPVGISMFDATGEGHRGPDARAAFYDEVISANPVHMDVHASYAGGNEVANVMTITTTFPDGSSAAVPLVGVYRVDDDGMIESLRGFWELDDTEFLPAP
jgi:ketosteroid isomerase-like protein